LELELQYSILWGSEENFFETKKFISLEKKEKKEPKFSNDKNRENSERYSNFPKKL
jgi:hypothetical protein